MRLKIKLLHFLILISLLLSVYAIAGEDVSISVQEIKNRAAQLNPEIKQIIQQAEVNSKQVDVSKLVDKVQNKNQLIQATRHSPYESGVIIFVSFSMPEQSLKAWIEQAKLIKAPLVVRGLIDNSFKKTIQKLKELGGGVQLDPIAFKRFQIKSVPSVVILSSSAKAETPQYDLVAGDVPLEEVLKFVEKNGVKTKEQANHLLKKIREQIHD